jgi:DNA-binding FrmR family transcriptional regulator
MTIDDTINSIVGESNSDSSPARKPASYAADKERILARLRRLEGQMRGVQRMVEEDKYCVDVLTQISAILAGTRAAGLLILEDHIRGCVVDAPLDDREEVLNELTQAIERFTRTVN